MQIEGVNAVGVSTGNVPAPAANNDVNSPISVGDSTTSQSNVSTQVDKPNREETTAAKGGPEPLKSMSTTDFLSLHNQYNGADNIMNKMMKILEAVLALKLLDETLEAAQGSEKGSNFKEIA